MSESLDVVGLECEEAMFYIKDVLRKGHGLPMAVRSASAPFHQLLSLWASSTDHLLHPAIKPVQGEVWELTVSKVMPC